MKKTLLATLAAALIASVAVPAMAAQGNAPRHGPRVERLMERFDADRDGTVLLEEVSAQRLATFNSADTDESGGLSKDELKAFGEQRKQMREQQREERRAERQSMMDEAMKDGQMGKDGNQDRRMAGKQHGRRAGEGRLEQRIERQMTRLDADDNGEISLEEFSALDARLFDRFDRNGDKKIDITDFYGKRAAN